ncbi:peptide chain release factor N(5)-glutamine methyltransferase [Corynebacterium pseudopelargi]|uniref:Release factor glutamine methyltransferase n=1 Tax=Corynebacterium pseudopelargi TaxID=2080757 RepID=A0A3G6IV43_9CORY|nr:peptide chain release factor N(5)-glutamine methyltransferase [Corynebacterium pseudopelargi]AZA09477.1 Release factor glutamine methyltransferase [Corynebacterium pseudopelargi]
MTHLAQALRQAEAILAQAGVASPLVDAKLIASDLLACSTLELHFHLNEPIPQGFWEAVERRKAREPLQYILGHAPFGPLELKVGPGVFIPRPETEVLADWAVKHTPPAATVVDFCTGSGALAAYIAHYCDAQVWAVERSVEAKAYAKRNLPSAVHLIQGDAGDLEHLAGLSHLEQSVDVVVSNPPYVPETKDLSPEVYFDPHEAVFGGKDGMALIPRLLAVAFRLLKDGGVIGVEHDDATSALVQEAFAQAGFSDIRVLKDFTGRARFVTGSKLSQRTSTILNGHS